MLRVRVCVRIALLLSLCIDYATGCNSADNQVRVSGISSITVQRGHTVVIAANTYNIFIHDKTKYNDCLVYVTSTPTFSCGSISPDVFNCSDKPDLLYTHYGCDSDTEHIDLALSLISSSGHNVFTAEPRTEHFTIEIIIMNIPEPILQPSDTIVVPPDTQKAIVSLKLADNSDCEYTVVTPIDLPYYGVVSGSVGQWVACNSSQRLEYTLVHQQWRQPEDRIIIAIRSSNSSGGGSNSISYEQIPVIISGSNDEKTSCMVERGELLVAFNCYTPVHVENLIGQNCSFARDWKVRITRGDQSVISSITSRGQHLTSSTFTLGQLEDGMVAYHRKSSSQADQIYQYQYTVQDLFGRIIFNDSIVTRSTALAGQDIQIIINRGIDVVEGHSVVITSEVLEFLTHNCTNFTLNLVGHPKYGWFRSATLVKLVLEDWRKMNITFVHAGDNNYADRAIWEVQCSGISKGRFLQPIRVMARDDSPPYMNKMSALLVHLDNVVQLSSFHLQAIDVDSCDTKLKYTILHTGGQFYSSKEDALNNSGTKVTQFTQQDINDGRIWYRPPKNVGLSRSDIVLLNVSDESFPPNVLSNQKLTVNVLISYDCAFSEAILDPKRLSEILVAEIAGETVLSTIHFNPFIEQFVSHHQLEIYIVDPPHYGSIVPSNFTLDSLSNKTVVYRHNGVSQDCNDSFIFQIRNSTGAEVFGKVVVAIMKQNTTQSISLEVNPSELSVIRQTLAANSIVITDAPVCPEYIIFVIKSLPKHGQVYFFNERNSTKLTIGSHFCLKHLKDGLLTYHYDVKSNQSKYLDSDGFNFGLYSPIGNLTANSQQLVHYPITYNLMDPIVNLNHPKSLHRCGESKFLYCHNLTISNINITSTVATDSELRIVVNDGPSCGMLILKDKKVSEFSLSQLKRMQIAYEFNATQCDHSNYNDSFGFFIKLAGQTARSDENYYLHLYWSYITVDQPSIEVNETDEIFRITVRRSGYLDGCSKVFCAMGSFFSASQCSSCNQLKLVMFSPRQTVAYCSFKIKDNNIAEGKSIKKYYVSLRNPEGAITTNRNKADILMSDLEDYPIIQFAGMLSVDDSNRSCSHKMTVKEGKNHTASVMIERIGDSSREVSVMCTVTARTARSLEDYVDSNKHWVTFAPGQKTAFCNITILDNDDFEEEEYFLLSLDRPRMLAITNSSARTLCVIIEEDDDLPVVFFGKTHMSFREKSINHTVDIPIKRTGNTEIPNTFVYYQTWVYDDDTADNNTDFKQYEKYVKFKSTQGLAFGKLVIVSDKEEESDETLHIKLLNGTNYQVGDPSTITIVILDSCQVIGFVNENLIVHETDYIFFLHLSRTGSLEFGFNISSAFSHNISSTHDPVGFNNSSMLLVPTNLHILKNEVIFKPGENHTLVIGEITDNGVYDGPKFVKYCMLTNESDESYDGIKFTQQCINIMLVDEEDYPTVKFERANYLVESPDYQECSVLAVAMVRNNDVNISSHVEYFTKDGSAVAGKHYYKSREVLHFAPGKRKKFIYIKICAHHLPTNQTSRFSIHVVKNNRSTRVVSPSITEVMILGKEPIVPYFHKEPIVHVLFNKMIGQKSLECVTPCDPLSTRYSDVNCSHHGINNNLTLYKWEISYNNISFAPVTYSTFFASAHSQMLNEFYLLPGSRIRCLATAVDATGVVGYTMPSEALEIPEENQLNCSSITTVEFHPSSPFTGRPQDSIKLSGSLSAAGNAAPLLYSRPQALPSALPLLTYYPTTNTSCVLFGSHLTRAGIGSVVATDCGWEFEVWMSMQALEDNCNARVKHTGEQTTVHLELELAYFYGNSSAGIELKQYRRQFNITGNFTHKFPLPDYAKYSRYDAGFIKLLDVSLKDVSLVKFKSFANFSGQFLMGSVSTSVSGDSSNQNHLLSIEETEQSIHNCTQTWSFHPTDVLFGGPYNITLVPCVLPDDVTWSPSILTYCTQMKPVTFQLYIPTGENVLPHLHTAETEILLLKRAGNGSYYSEWRFELDDWLYGGIKINTQDQQHVTVSVQKVVVCSTMGGYMPQYDYKTSLTGCLTDTQYITKLYTVMEVNDPIHNTENDFDAKIIDEINDVRIGWSFRIAPLYDVHPATQLWFVHTVYSETHNANVITKHDIRVIHLETLASCADDATLAWCQGVISTTIALTVLVIVVLTLILICWKWNMLKDRFVAVFGDCSGTKTETSHLSKIRRSHRYRAEIQEIPQAFLAPDAIHASTEQCTKNSTTHATGGSTNSRLTGSKKYIVETAM